MAYTPELRQEHSATLRRIAWALDTPMTKAMGHIFDYLATKIDNTLVCQKCRDHSKCKTCSFTLPPNRVSGCPLGFPTPGNVVYMMSQMTLTDVDKTTTVISCCLGTGTMLL